MKITGVSLGEIDRGLCLRLGGYFICGALTAMCCLDQRAPLATGYLSACRQGRESAAALAGALAGSAVFLPFAPALRCWGTWVLALMILSTFRATSWYQHALFRPLTAAGTTLAVELAYTLSVGISRQGVLRLLSCTILAGVLCHYCALLLRETAIPRRRAAREASELRERLRTGADALQALTRHLGGGETSEENPAVVFDRAAEVVCRGCALRETCWSHEYVDTFNAFNDATPAILEQGRAEAKNFSGHFASRCIHFPQLLSAINTEVTALLLRRQYYRLLEQERGQARRQYAQLGELVAQAAAMSDTAARSALLPFDVAVSTAARAGARVCGDTAAYFQDGSTVYLLLSDGMGSGREAQRESQMGLELTKKFLLAGIQPDTALRTLNDALRLRSDVQGCFTTMDLLALDLADYQAALYKYGAAPSYIKHQGNVRRLTGNSLPAGLHSGLPPLPIRFPLQSGMFLLMISDGVADSGDDKWLQDLLAGWNGTNPQTLADLVMSECRKRRHGEDDCSLLCLALPAEKRGRQEV